ncbi:MAG: ATP-dependent DNA helicase [Gammaproteobacteria bacterium]|nr:ATP-dependent DNA helicase [Gammaproteobacteria bacterium]
MATDVFEQADSAAWALGPDGPFARQLDSFTVRKSQQQMAAEIEACIEQRSALIAESGTGTGKTFAYLVPALLSGEKTIVSTGTKHLQEQLFHRDLPQVMEKLGVSAKVSLLKGRSNYVCLQRLQQCRSSSRRLDKKQLHELETIAVELPTSKSGDIAQLGDIAEDSAIWPQVTSTVDNCLGQGCSYFDDCFVNKARKEALSSDVVVINHHLYFADKALKNDGFGALLPETACIIFDEAHQIPDIASNFLGHSFSSWQVMELVRDTRSAELKEKSLVPALISTADELDKMVVDYRLSLGLQERRVAWQELATEVPGLPRKMQLLAETLERFAEALELAAAKGEALARCHERALELCQACRALIEDAPEQRASVRWVEIAKRTFRIHQTPLDIGAELSEFFANTPQARIFTSATLSVAGGFSHFQQLVGLPEGTAAHSWDSPFDYYNQAVLYVPEGLPEPKEDSFTQAIYDAVLPVLHAAAGRSFVLFTSFRIMQRFEELLQGQDLNVLMQGQRNKQELLSEFVRVPRSVLLGTMSFWEGVDVPGDALSCVVIDKLPFESPFDPVLKARLQAMQDAGENPFMNYQVPRAVITLRQGAGRLIRSQQDRGVLMLCDARLRRTHYGKIFLQSLPPMRRTADESKVCGFLQSATAVVNQQEEDAK